MYLLKLMFVALIATSGATATYKDEAAKYSVEYPMSWDKKQLTEYKAIAFLRPLAEGDKFQENVNVMPQDLSAKPMTLKEFADFSKEQMHAYEGFGEILSEKQIRFAGFPAEEIVYTATMGGNKLKFYQVWFIKNKTAFVLTYTATEQTYTKYEKDAKAIFSSFKFY